jgi:polyisoprenoid-binding protein YceI
MTKPTRLLLLIAALWLSACGILLKPKLETDLVQLRSGEYQLDPRHAALLFKVDHMGFSKFVGRFKDFNATLDFRADDIAASRLEAVINMASVDVNDEELEDTLRSADWFDTQQFPQALFRTLAVENIDGNTADFAGELTFLGITRPVTIRIRFNGGATNLLTYKYTIGFAASSTFKRSDFGLDKYIPMVGDEIEIEVHAEFMRD